MPRYLFHIRKDDHGPDTIGVDLQDHEAARAEACRFLAVEMRDHISDLWADGEWHVDVADEQALILFAVSSAAFEAAAGRNA